jgi:DNA-binding NtrC family response regulator
VRVENLVLLVEDDAPLRRSLEKFLNQAGYTFDSCSTATQALALARKVPPQVVILEYHLPDADGPFLIENLMFVAPSAAAIVLSEYDFQAIADDLDRVKIAMFLKKPFDIVDLEVALRSACAKDGGNSSGSESPPETKLEGAPASNCLQGTLRSRI